MYKRQISQNAQSTQEEQIAQAKIKEQQIKAMQNISLIEIIKPVSYTHLDVYKRQTSTYVCKYWRYIKNRHKNM